ncbi:hypothetical protein YPPY66_2080 [Yersinia pestis PY-66]|uniref:Uncharacterized protein n=1 Tax=Yersinia pestis biovar Orientalis str. IP275 TaxID=373665 RepID=A0AAV3AVA6_YERPE|nr:hypothetical protein YPIP275_1827 [Yersinia pestis biovar Orientalis str. IP275]EDR45067.1 hypothetical protein YpE1979001_1659 [Yersinia pestis biovar Antiqua str. E1979001]EIQ91381.1 hypothetical protein YPPY02_1841 [Yersinia pestis PY-02]EIR47906.1 hypothetical protein YPPY13_1909 [Yersinia pestis PY-13]EIR48718.1 hypothetical protein YPPY15_1865 [Yersinia pestis PY-15]EIR50755.1 hypothetical protein YPPY14_1860 [Yersinia pestis PY-14]EIR66509.1 hypothetical protein YPPY25_1909 [Yersini
MDKGCQRPGNDTNLCTGSTKNDLQIQHDGGNGLLRIEPVVSAFPDFL